jgi:hypothetical protein
MLHNDSNNQNVSSTLTFADETTPAISVPSIGTSAMLVELSISTWTARKKDKQASEDVTRTNGADSGAASVNKNLLSGCDELTAVRKFGANARNIHYSMTMPWSDVGLRLLPTAMYAKYHQTMTELQDEFERLGDVFINAYGWEYSQAQARLGALWRADDYPSIESIASKFGFRLNYMPLPDAGDFRIDVGADAVDQMKTHYEEFYSEQIQRAMDDVWRRVYDSLFKMSERLDYGDHEEKKIFRDTLVDNVLDMVDLLDVCNVTGDSQMSAMRLNLEDALRGVTPDALRDDAFLRAETKRAVDNAINSLPSLDI